MCRKNAILQFLYLLDIRMLENYRLFNLGKIFGWYTRKKTDGIATISIQEKKNTEKT